MGVAGAKLQDEDYVTDLIHTSAHAYLLFFSNRGRVYRLKAHQIPMRDRTARGTAIVNLLPLQPDEHIQAIIDTRDYETHRFLFFVTRNGTVKKTKFTEYDSSLQAGLIAINLRDGDELVRVMPTNGDDDILMVSADGPGHPLRRGRRAPMGRDRRRRPGHEAARGRPRWSRADVVADDDLLLTITDGGFGKRTEPSTSSTARAAAARASGPSACTPTRARSSPRSWWPRTTTSSSSTTRGVIIRMPVARHLVAGS